MPNITNHQENVNQTTMRYYLIPVRIAIIKKTRNNCRQGCGEKGNTSVPWWECKLVQPLWKTVWRLLKKLKLELLYNPAILLQVFIQRIQKHSFEKIHVSLRSLQHYLQ